MKTRTADCHPSRKHYSKGMCRPCYTSIYYKEYYKDPANAEKRRAAVKRHADKQGDEWRYNRWLQHKFGITIEVYNKMLTRQNGTCAVCKTSDPGHGRKFFCVDHDHKTERIRGLLCDDCNLAAGKLKDNPDAALALAEYLKTRPARKLIKKVAK